MKTLQLSDGTHIPWLAFGTGTALYNRDASDVARLALTTGFTHLDGAQVYNNEESLGTAIARAISESKMPREDLYITTKLEKIPDGGTVEEKLRVSLEKLGVSYVDLFLVHMPRQHDDREGGIKQVWREMVDVKTKGLARSIGVSNFNTAQLKEIISLGLEVPVVNQIEYHPLLARTLAPLLEYQRANGIVTVSYGGLTPILPSRGGSGGEALAKTRAKISTVLNTLASARSVRGKPATQNQVLLKWLEDAGVMAVTTSSKESRLREYIDTEALPSLTPEEKTLITDAVGETQFRAFTLYSYMDDN